MRSAVEPGLSLRLERSMQGLAGLGAWVDRAAAVLHLPAAQEYALRLCLEEAVTNVVMHGTPAAGESAGLVTVDIRSAPDGLHVVVEDDCAPFDPLAQPAPNARRSLDEPLGGWGIQLMRQFTRSMSYQRVGEMNRLALTIGHEAGPG